MRLETSHGRSLSNPTPHDVEQALATLAEPDAFVILSRAAEDYVQASGDALEYRDANGHYRAIPSAGPDLRRRVFLTFLDGGDGFRKLCSWTGVGEEIERRPPRRPSPAATIVGLLIAAGVLLLAAWRAGLFG